MPKLLTVRALTTDEAQIIKQLAHSRTAAVRVVERARIVWLAAEGWHVPALGAHLQLHPSTVRRWLTRFNTGGLAELTDAPRSGRPTTYTPEEVGVVIATALTDPRTLGQPVGPGKSSTTDDGARATFSGPSAPPPARR